MGNNKMETPNPKSIFKFLKFANADYFDAEWSFA
jgi:hypothetical protein